VLFALATGPAAIATALADPVPDRTTLAAGLVGLVVALAGYALLPTVPGMLAIAAASITATVGALELVAYPPRLAPMFAFVGLGLLFGLVAAARLLVPRRIGLALGAGIAIAGAHLASVDSQARAWTYGLTVLIGLVCFVGYWWTGPPCCWCSA
jgi:hypothetical protein